MSFWDLDEWGLIEGWKDIHGYALLKKVYAISWITFGVDESVDLVIVRPKHRTQPGDKRALLSFEEYDVLETVFVDVETDLCFQPRRKLLNEEPLIIVTMPEVITYVLLKLLVDALRQVVLLLELVKDLDARLVVKFLVVV